MRLGFRHALPILLLLLYVILIAVSGEWQREPLPPEVARQLADMDLTPPPPLAMQIAVAVNLPAALPTIPIVLAENWLRGGTSARLDYVVFGLFVPVLWYFVGRWVDRRVGLATRVTRSPSRIATIGFAFLVVVTIFAAAGLVGGRPQGGHGDRMVRFAAFLWAAFAAVVLYVRITRETRKTA